MTKRKFHLLIRKSHRYLGLILGIQFLFWTAGGLYFSWSDIDEIHGDFQHKHPPKLTSYHNLISPSAVFEKNKMVPDSIQGLQLISILNKPHYLIHYFSKGMQMPLMADAVTGVKRSSITKEEAIQMAADNFIGEPVVEDVAYVTSVSKHSEYREKPLPAWKVKFKHASETNIYISAEQGKVETFRNEKWRTFDLLWMFHTMDYSGRDNFNNWILRAFSIFGMVTILSGFTLFFVSRKKRGLKKNDVQMK